VFPAFSAIVLVFKLMIQQIQKFRRPMKAKSSVVQNGTAATSAKQPATSSKPTAASPTFVDKAIKEIDNFEGLLLALVKLGFILVPMI
jgi:hypothetical protein